MDRATWERGYHRAQRRQKIAFARVLRAEMTVAEKRLWTYLRAKRFCGLKFRRQEAMGPYIADFCCHKKKLIVEIDGSSHTERKDYDRDRDLYFEMYGYRVLRLSNDDVLEQYGEPALQRIRAAIESQVPLSCKERG